MPWQHVFYDELVRDHAYKQAHIPFFYMEPARLQSDALLGIKYILWQFRRMLLANGLIVKVLLLELNSNA